MVNCQGNEVYWGEAVLTTCLVWDVSPVTGNTCRPCESVTCGGEDTVYHGVCPHGKYLMCPHFASVRMQWLREHGKQCFRFMMR